MTVAELIKALKQMPQDAQVYSYTDHGQTYEKSAHPSVFFVEEVGYTLDCIYDNEEVAEECGVDHPTAVVVL